MIQSVGLIAVNFTQFKKKKCWKADKAAMKDNRQN